jgi:hypothetical protein
MTALVACGGGATGGGPVIRGGPDPYGIYPPRDLQNRRPLTRAERTGFTETSHYQDVIAFLDSLKTASEDVHVLSMGRTGQGRDIPVVVLSRPVVHTPTEAKRLGRPIVYIQANIHGGEVEGKEALQAILRDLARDQFQNVVDSLVIVAVPIYNADGNEAFDAQEKNRDEQNGPALVGQRANAQGLDLNRDYVKAEAPETRAALDFLRAWEPDVFMDLHTTDGSYHGYALTWAPPLNPAARFSGPFTRDTVLPAIRLSLHTTQRIETFPYGNFISQDSAFMGWYTYDHRPRFGTNYYGLRGRMAILAEAYSHDPFRRRIATMYSFVMETLSMLAHNHEDIIEVGREADRRTTAFASTANSSPPIAIRSRLTRRPRQDDVLIEDVMRVPDSARTEPGVPAGWRRTGRMRTIRIPVFDRFEPTLEQSLPYAWVIPAQQSALLEMLRRHGVFVEQATERGTVRVERFAIDSVVQSPRPFQGHQETRLAGRWLAPDTLALEPDMYVVRGAQPMGILALYLLEPQSDDGLVTWNFLDQSLRVGERYPIVRVVDRIPVRLRAAE